MEDANQKPEALLQELEDRIASININGCEALMLHHPLLVTMYWEELNGHYNDILNAKRSLVQGAKEEGNWSLYLGLHERSFRTDAMLEIADDIMIDQEYWETLGWLCASIGSKLMLCQQKTLNKLLSADRRDGEYYHVGRLKAQAA